LCFDSLALRRRVRGSSPRLFMPCFACRGSRWGQCFAFRSPFQSRKRLPSKPSCGVSKKSAVFLRKQGHFRRKTPLFLALCSRLSSQSWALLKIGLWRASFHFTRSNPDRPIGVTVLCKESLFFLYSVEKATAKNAHFLVCCAKHSAFSRERHKYALSCS